MENPTIEVDLTDEEEYTLMKMAHSQDITLNKLVCNILAESLSITIPDEKNETKS